MFKENLIPASTMFNGKEGIERMPLLHKHMSPLELVKSTQWEHYPYGENGNTVSGVVGHWGPAIGNDELAYFYNYHGLTDSKGNPFTVQSHEITKPGFDRRHTYPLSTTKDEAMKAEEEIGVLAIEKACELRGIKPSQVSLIFVSGEFMGKSDTPDENARIPRKIADRAGISKSAHVYNLVLACNSGAEARRMVGERQNELDGQCVLYLELEGLTKVIPPDYNDPGIPVFTNGVTAGVHRVGKDYAIVAGQFNRILDPEGSLTGPFYWPVNPLNEQEFMVTQDSIRQPLQNPKNDDFGRMDSAKTIRWILRYVKPELVKSFRYLQSMGFFKNGVITISHPASKPVQDKLYKRASEELGIELNPVWYKNDGNSSCAASTTVLYRAAHDGVLRQAKAEGRDVFFKAFGAGGNGSGMIIQIPDSMP